MLQLIYYESYPLNFIAYVYNTRPALKCLKTMSRFNILIIQYLYKY